MLEYYRQYCHFIRKGINTDIVKSMTEGKAVIIEGCGLDLELIVRRTTQDECLSPKLNTSLSSQKIQGSYLETSQNQYEIVLPDLPEFSAMAEQLSKIDQSKAFIVPLQLTVTREEHCQMLQQRRKMTEESLDKFQCIQSYLDKNSQIQTRLQVSSVSSTVQQIQDLVLSKIENSPLRHEI